MTVEALNHIGIGLTEAKARGCKFCGAKSLTIAANGVEFWHAATDCCNPTLLLQAVWRKQDHDRVAAHLNRTSDPRARVDLEHHLAELDSEYQRCARNLLEAVGTEEELEEAIRTARAAGYDAEDYRSVRAAFMSRRHGRPA